MEKIKKFFESNKKVVLIVGGVLVILGIFKIFKK